MDPILEPEHHLPTAALIRRALDETRLLARAEVLHAKRELLDDIHAAKLGGLFVGLALACATWGIALLLVLLAFAFAKPAVGALVVGVGLLVLASIAAGVGLKALPRSALPLTRHRVKSDWATVRRRLAHE